MQGMLHELWLKESKVR